MSTQNIFAMTDTWNAGATTFTAIGMNVTDTASAAGSLLLDLRVGGVTKASITKQGRIVAGAGYQYANPQFYDSTEGTTTGYGIGANSATMYVAGTANLDVGNVSNGIRIRDELWLGWAPGHALSNPADTRLYRDAANTLAQRNGTNAQVFRIYQTFTSISQNAYLNVRWAGTDCRIQTTSVGAESAGTLTFGTGGIEAWRINASNHLVAVTDNTFDIGASGANRPRNVFWAGYQEMSEMTAPAAPAANNVRIYAEDNGSGKTRLMARFATGAAVQIAIEP